MQRKFLPSVVVSLAIITHSITTSSAFTALRPTEFRSNNVRYSSVTSLHMNADHLSNEADGFSDDLEATRKHLESLVASGASSDQAATGQHEFENGPRRPMFASISIDDSSSMLSEPPRLDVSVPPRPPLTTIERERRSAEIQLLAFLQEGDDVLQDVSNLWFSERGEKTSKRLLKAKELIDMGKEGWAEAEQILLDVYDEYGVYFVEPVNCLATLYYLQGRYEDALTLNQIVLSIKPWHVGALSHIVMVYAALGDSQSARQWAAFRLPVFSDKGANRRRTRWVERAVLDATIQLHEGEKNLSNSFGESDKIWIQNFQRRNKNIENTLDAWQ